MKQLSLLILASLCAVVLPLPLQAQGVRIPLCGTPNLRDPAVVAQAWKNTLALHPELRQLGKRAEVQTYSLGDIDTFYVYNFTNGALDLVPAKLMEIGSLAYVWVAVSELQPPAGGGEAHVDSLTTNEFLQALETKTPGGSRDSTKGVVALDKAFFGNPPNINSSFVKGLGDGKTHFLVCDIQDGWAPLSGGYIAGFFISNDVDGTFSPNNHRDLLYIDSYPGIYFNGSRDLHEALNTLAHEFQHLIHWNYDPDEIDFFNEGLSEYASYVCGYGLRPPRGYFDNPNVSLLGWSSTLEDYSRAALWTLYVSEQCGDTFIRNLVQNALHGTNGFNNTLDQSGIGSSFLSTVRNFHTDNVLHNRAANAAFGYLDTLATSGKPAPLRSVLGANLAGSRTGLMPLAADYLRFFGTDTLQTTITASLGSLSVRGIQINDAGIASTDIGTGTPLQMIFAGSQKSEALIVVQNTGETQASGYGYEASGVTRTSSVFELANDDGGSQHAPNTNLQRNDTVFVRFEGIEGGIIDSVGMWFATKGSARLFVRDYNMQYNFTTQPLSGIGAKAKMFSPVSFTVSDTGFMRTVVPLRQFAMSSYPDFVVELIYDTAIDPQLKRDSSQEVLRSFLSLSSRPGDPQRVIYTSFGDFYLRAYLSPGGDNPPTPLPIGFALFQNYPNPFNPNTVITYDLPVRSHVKLAVYDLLGREVAVLKDEEEDAQRHVVSFNASRLSTGIYFCRLTTPTFTDTKKMMLVH